MVTDTRIANLNTSAFKAYFSVNQVYLDNWIDKKIIVFDERDCISWPRVKAFIQQYLKNTDHHIQCPIEPYGVDEWWRECDIENNFFITSADLNKIYLVFDKPVRFNCNNKIRYSRNYWCVLFLKVLGDERFGKMLRANIKCHREQIKEYADRVRQSQPTHRIEQVPIDFNRQNSTFYSNGNLREIVKNIVLEVIEENATNDQSVADISSEIIKRIN